MSPIPPFGDPAVPTWLLLTGAALLGLVIGSFLNVVIVRLPRMMEREWARQYAAWQAQREGSEPPASEAERYDLAWPGSHCPSCQHPIRWHQNLPVIGWLRLRGRCAHCNTAIAWHYPVVEALGAVCFAVCAWRFGASWTAVAAMGLCAALIALAFIDLHTMLLPDDVTLPLLWAGLLLNVGGMWVPLHEAVIGAAAGYGVLWMVFHIFRLVTGKEGMGYGDFKLLAALGAWFGWRALPEVLLLSSVAGVVVGGVLLLAGRAARGQPLPFGPYLAMAGVVALFGRQGGSGWLGL